MSLESNLTAILKSVSPRTFSGFAPTDTPRPYITFQQIGGEVIRPLANEVASKENAEMQVTVWADNPSAAKAAITQIEALLVTAVVMQSRSIAAATGDYDAAMERYSYQQDFSIWCDR